MTSNKSQIINNNFFSYERTKTKFGGGTEVGEERSSLELRKMPSARPWAGSATAEARARVGAAAAQARAVASAAATAQKNLYIPR